MQMKCECLELLITYTCKPSNSVASIGKPIVFLQNGWIILEGGVF